MEAQPRIEIVVSAPVGPKPKRMSKEDVWGVREDGRLLHKGMIIARGYGLSNEEVASRMDYPQRCPFFGDVLPYKSVSVKCSSSQIKEVEYWLEYVLGGGCIEKKQRQGKSETFVIRANYMCW